MVKKDTKYDVAVIGSGPAGMIAAGKASELGLKVVLIEKNSVPAKKLFLTGNGRCNFTNAEFDLKSLVSNYNNGEFLFHAFSVFNPERAIKFFNQLGVRTKTEKNKRVFPVSNDAEEILEVLNKHLTYNKVDRLFNTDVIDIEKENNPPLKKTVKGKIIKLILKDRDITAKKYILCTGGKSYPLTGSDGSGYKLAEKLGHTIIPPSPALSPINLKEEWIKNLQGISLKDVKIEVSNNNKKILKENGEIMFTHFGISGPAILDISGKVGNLLENGEAKINLDLYPLLNHEELFKRLEEVFKKHPKKAVKNVLSDFMPERLTEVLLDVANIDKNKIANSMSKIEKLEIVKIIKKLKITPESILGFDKALVTKGGISLKEIDHKTMKSKIIDNLFFAGEIIDVDGKTGGFNLQMCWSTGFIAGQNCK